ncbi:hypothetical protein N7539_007783 [Penicillium diatomitis]|uniref:Uncharacterized protein n=1 Tax=Penicillium diatomitis TaxID=2819901 RepID=A0A9X0BNA9_9EURO|nr:uncharacterized protein N7539_007783 [Penicillium diatomitis]KAJ5475496.1 hypothetical protein N7539_007783 [Penicillium diatomitis]
MTRGTHGTDPLSSPNADIPALPWSLRFPTTGLVEYYRHIRTSHGGDQGRGAHLHLDCYATEATARTSEVITPLRRRRGDYLSIRVSTHQGRTDLTSNV